MSHHPEIWRGEEDWQRERYDSFTSAAYDWRRYKRENRKAWFVRWPELKTRQKSRGFARHIRRIKAS